MLNPFFRIPIIFILCLPLLACSETKQSAVNTVGLVQTHKATHKTAHSASPTIPNWKVSYHRSGGIMGLIQEMTLSHDGQRLLSNHGKPSKALTPLDTQQVAQLNQLLKKLAAMTPDKTSHKSNTKCRDCLSYKVHIDYGEQLIQFSAINSTSTNAEQQKLLQFLSGITPLR